MGEISKKLEESRSYYIWPPRGVNMRIFGRAVQKKTTGSNVFENRGNNAHRLCLLHETHF